MWQAAFDVVRFDAAIDWFKRRVPITDVEFQRNATQSRRQAFWVAGVTQANVIRDVHESLMKALADGVPFETWKAEIGPKLSKAWLGTVKNEAARTETIFRNWAQASYARARWDQMHEPSVLRFRPYLMFDGVEDSRQSPICQACNGTLLPAGHPWWDAHRPPLHHRCRSGIRSLRKEQAEARGITKDPTDVGPQEGFGDGGEWKGPDRAKYLPGVKPPAKPKVAAAPKPPPSPLPITGAEVLESSAAGKAAARKAKAFLNSHPRVSDLESYTGGGYRRINASLRDPSKVSVGELADAIQKAEGVQRILKDAKEAGLAFNGVVQRGEVLADMPAALRTLYQTVGIGERIQFAAFTSATTSQKVAGNFADGVLLRIRQRSGVPVSQASLLRHEQEVLLPPGRKFVVLRRTERGGNIVIDLQEVDD